MKAQFLKKIGLWLLISGFVLGLTAAWLLLKRPLFLAEAKIRVTDGPSQTQLPGERRFIPQKDPSLTHLKFAAQHEDTLNRVIEALGLRSEWSRRFAASGPLPPAEALTLLRHRVSLHRAAQPRPQPDHYVIRARSELPAEAASIANALAETYRDRVMGTETSGATAMVEIIQSAVPPTAPLLANQAFGWSLLGCGIILSGIGGKRLFASPRLTDLAGA